MKLLDEIVCVMLDKHGGGEIFFDNLDKAVQNNTVIDQLINLLRSSHKSIPNIIVSGDFGRFFINYTSWDESYIVQVNGGIRTGTPVDNLEYIPWINEDYIFIDDSFYSGKTRDAIKKELERHGGNLWRTYVIYDGSKVKDPEVFSLFRYYDHYGG